MYLFFLSVSFRVWNFEIIFQHVFLICKFFESFLFLSVSLFLIIKEFLGEIYRGSDGPLIISGNGIIIFLIIFIGRIAHSLAGLSVHLFLVGLVVFFYLLVKSVFFFSFLQSFIFLFLERLLCFCKNLLIFRLF